uniref:PDZ domain-containing protein 8 n=1 Tax=Magallana gigas TaxID=29159 RepID=K1PAR0_MAGGI
MLVTAILCSFIFGVVFTLLVQFLFLRNQLNNTPVEPIKNRPQFTDFKLPKKLDVEVDLDYRGGFQLALGIDLVLGKQVFLSVTVMNLQGRARLQFSHKPYTHWSFSFYEEPQIDFLVESKFGGRATPQLTSLIIKQVGKTAKIKRTIRKKHTLPNYKFRMKPFFTPPPPRVPQKDLFVNGAKIGQGKLTVTIKGCSRLIDVPADSFLYCTLSVDSCPWLELLEKKKRIWVIQDIEIIKGSAESIGLSFKEDFLLDKYEDVVVVDFITADSPADKSDIRKGDILTYINNVKVTTSKQAAKLFKGAGERFLVRIERARMKNHAPHDLQITEDNVSIKDFPQSDVTKTSECSEDFVNISINAQQVAKTSYPLPSPSSSPQKRVLDLVNTGLGKGKTLLKGRLKSNAINEPPTNLQVTETKGSPLPIRRNLSDKNLSQLGTSPSGSSGSLPFEDAEFKARCQSDASSIKSLESAEGQPLENSEDEDENFDIIQTIEIPSCSNPTWNETFTFNVEADEKFLNVCVSCKIPEKLDKQNKIVKPSKVFPVGQVSSDRCRGKFASYSGHPGFDPALCFGDITLSLSHHPHNLGDRERKQMTRKLPVPVPVTIKKEERAPATMAEVALEGATKKSGPMRKSDPTVPWKPLLVKKEVEKKKIVDTSTNILKKFTQKKTTTPTPQPPIHKPTTPTHVLPYTLSPSISPASLRRRNSAPNTESATDLGKGSRFAATTVTHTHSTSSLQHFVSSLSQPCVDDSRSLANSDYTSDESDFEMEEMISAGMKKKRKGQNLDEMVVMAAKEMGKELYADLSLAERKAKLDAMVSKLQKEIDEESENKRDLVKAEEETIDLAHKALLRNQIEKSEEKVEALMMMMLHHCAGLQYCLDQEQEEKQRRASSDMSSASIDKNTKQPLKETKSSDSNLGKSLNKAEVQMVCPAISVEVASSPEENVEDFTLFPEKEDDSMHMEDPSNMSQDSEDSDQMQEEDEMYKSAIDEKEEDKGSLLSFTQPGTDVDEEDILADVLNTVTEIIEKSEGETDSSDIEDTITHSIQ